MDTTSDECEHYIGIRVGFAEIFARIAVALTGKSDDYCDGIIDKMSGMMNNGCAMSLTSSECEMYIAKPNNNRAWTPAQRDAIDILARASMFMSFTNPGNILQYT
jgi:hypothetical protein